MMPTGPHPWASVKNRALASGTGRFLSMAVSLCSQFGLQEGGTQNDSLYKLLF